MKRVFFCLAVTMIYIMATCVYASNAFYDTRGTKYEGVVERMAKLGIINGMNETTYAPNKGITRAELSKIVVKISGFEKYAEGLEYKTVFSDVKKSDWFYSYVQTASELGLIKGYGDGTFKPDQEVTYAEAITILLRNLGYTNIKNDSNIWYMNYIKKMSEIKLNDNVGWINYDTPAKRGDIAILVWNGLITDKWVIYSENEKTGITYSYSDKTQLETLFDGYKFLDNEGIRGMVANDGKYGIEANEEYYYSEEKIPLYALGGNVTALYIEKTGELIGVTIDEKLGKTKIISGPIFYLEEEGYNPSKARNSVAFGSKSKATFAYLIVNEETNEIERTVYIDASDSQLVKTISIKLATASGDKEEEAEITINEDTFPFLKIALTKDGLVDDWTKLSEGMILTNLGNGVYTYSKSILTGELVRVDDDDKFVIGDDIYLISNDCVYSIEESEDELLKELGYSKFKKYFGTNVTIHINAAEEICKIEFEKPNDNDEIYKIGFADRVIWRADIEIQQVDINYGNQKSGTIDVNPDNAISLGDLVAICKKDGKTTVEAITQDAAFENDVGIKYKYDAKKISYPMIGEYIVNENTKYYKITLTYADNSITNIEKVEAEEMNLGENIDDLSAYSIILVYNENMEIIKVFAVNEVNKFDNQIGLVMNIKRYKEDDKEFNKITLSVVNEQVRGYKIGEYSGLKSGDIITFNATEDTEKDEFELNEVFECDSIGFKRDLIVNEFDKGESIITFKNGSSMNLQSDVYDWQGKKINLNGYRFVLAKVSNREGFWKFEALEMVQKKKLKVKTGDRVAVGELDKVIVIYRGYVE